MLKVNKLFECPCGASIVNKPSYIKNHNKTNKHQTFLETGEKWEPGCASESCPYVVSYRATLRKEMGTLKYKEMRAAEMRTYRLKKRMENAIDDEGDANNEGDDDEEEKHSEKKKVSILPKKVIDKDSMMEFMSEMLEIIENDKKTRDPIVIKEYISKAIKTFQSNELEKLTIEELVDKLPRFSLVNPSKTIDKKTNFQNMEKIKLLYRYTHTNDNFQAKDLINPTWLENIENVRKQIKKHTKTQESERAYYTAVLSTFTRIDQEKYAVLINTYRDLQNTLQKEIFTIRQANLLSLREKRNWMDWKDILKYNDEDWNSRDKLIKALYTCIPPRRLEYGDLILTEERKDNTIAHMKKSNENYLVMKDDEPKCIILNRYKTWKRYGSYEIDLQNKSVDDKGYVNYKNLLKAVKEFLKGSKLKEGDYVFGRKYGSDFGKEINNVFEGTGKLISCDILRHSFISNFFRNVPDAFSNNDAFLKVYSDAMGHSAYQFQTYRKLDEKGFTEKYIEDELEVETEDYTEKITKSKAFKTIGEIKKKNKEERELEEKKAKDNTSKAKEVAAKSREDRLNRRGKDEVNKPDW